MLRKRDDGDRDDRGPRGPRGDRPDRVAIAATVRIGAIVRRAAHAMTRIVGVS